MESHFNTCYCGIFSCFFDPLVKLIQINALLCRHKLGRHATTASLITVVYLIFVSLQEVHIILGSLVSGMNLIHMLSEFARKVTNCRNHAHWLSRSNRNACYFLHLSTNLNIRSINCSPLRTKQRLKHHYPVFYVQ